MSMKLFVDFCNEQDEVTASALYNWAGCTMDALDVLKKYVTDDSTEQDDTTQTLYKGTEIFGEPNDEIIKFVINGDNTADEIFFDEKSIEKTKEWSSHIKIYPDTKKFVFCDAMFNQYEYRFADCPSSLPFVAMADNTIGITITELCDIPELPEKYKFVVENKMMDFNEFEKLEYVIKILNYVDYPFKVDNGDITTVYNFIVM